MSVNLELTKPPVQDSAVDIVSFLSFKICPNSSSKVIVYSCCGLIHALIASIRRFTGTVLIFGFVISLFA